MSAYGKLYLTAIYTKPLVSQTPVTTHATYEFLVFGNHPIK